MGGSLTVEQDRDPSVDVAGISAGFSCTSIGQKIRVKDISIAYWSIEFSEILFPNSPNFQEISELDSQATVPESDMVHSNTELPNNSRILLAKSRLLNGN